MDVILKNALTIALNAEPTDFHFNAISGGDINDAYRLDDGRQFYFAKANAANRFPQMFEAEASGLNLLKEAQLNVPNVLSVYEERNVSVLLLQWIEKGSKTNAFWEKLGRELADLHRNTNEQFGLGHDNYIGSLKQINTPKADWPTFFIENRINPQLRLAADSGLINLDDLKAFEKLFSKIDELFALEKPALLHGDFWSGNYLCDENENPWFFDPAVYYGHRLMDLGMTRLFGGFEQRFYDSYNEVYPFQQHWIRASEIANLYPLLVHVNLFGGSYVSQVRSVLKSAI